MLKKKSIVTEYLVASILEVHFIFSKILNKISPSFFRNIPIKITNFDSIWKKLLFRDKYRLLFQIKILLPNEIQYFTIVKNKILYSFLHQVHRARISKCELPTRFVTVTTPSMFVVANVILKFDFLENRAPARKRFIFDIFPWKEPPSFGFYRRSGRTLYV